ncbi:DUF2231 domain-containing protein [Oryzifoliimicrobium ureilyticus]|uniref:DUF2231 domain-containing protein n=1 Tax=Oryzifoliimicrobium ureilyticus TaxID=3113724 RepID=UPI00307679C4
MPDASLHANDASAFPMQSLFVPFPFVCFTIALGTDIVFSQTANVMWQNFSAWLLFIGLVFGALSFVAGLIDLLRRRTWPLRPSFAAILSYLVMLALGLLNSLIHAGDGWTAVVPYGLLTSAVTFFVALVTISLSIRKYARLAWRL